LPTQLETMKIRSTIFMIALGALLFNACGIFKSTDDLVEEDMEEMMEMQDMAPAPIEEMDAAPMPEPMVQSIEGGQTGRVIPKRSPRGLVRWTSSDPDQKDYPYDNYGTLRVQKVESQVNVLLLLNDGSSQTIFSAACNRDQMPELDVYAHKVAPETTIPELWIFYSDLNNGLNVQVNTVANPSKKLSCSPNMPSSISPRSDGNYYIDFLGSELQFFNNAEYPMPPAMSFTYRLF
jgi:hypothetical protein